MQQLLERVHRLCSVWSFGADEHFCPLRWGECHQVEDIFAVDFLAVVGDTHML